MVDLESSLRGAAASARSAAEREEIYGAADGISAIRRRLRATAARETTDAPIVLRDVVTVGPLTIDPIRRYVDLDGKRLELSQKEYQLLLALAADPSRVFTKAELLKDVWGYKLSAKTRTVDAHACHLRRKLGTGWIVNARGVGYRLTDDAERVG